MTSIQSSCRRAIGVAAAFISINAFTHIGPTTDDIAKQNPGVTARSYLLSKLCADADTRDMMRDGLTFPSTYVDEKIARTDGAVLTEADCAKIARR